MAISVAMINMKGGVGKTTLAFNFAWYAAWKRNLKVLAEDLDPQSNLSQYFLGAQGYLNHVNGGGHTVVEVFEQFSHPTPTKSAPSAIAADSLILKVHEWDDGSLLHLLPSRLELAWTLKNPTEKARLLPRFLSKVAKRYDLIIVDCAPTESILTAAAYLSSRYVVVPVRLEFLATIGLPLLARSLSEFKIAREDHSIDMAGIVFNDVDPRRLKPEQRRARRDVIAVAKEHGWLVFDNEARHSDSYARGARAGAAIFHTKYARGYVQGEFYLLGDEFVGKVGL